MTKKGNYTKKRKTHKKGIRNYTRTHTRTHTHTLKASCSPKQKEKQTGFSCYTKDDIRYLRNLWNKHLSGGNNDPKYIQSNQPHQIYNQLSQHLAPQCGNNEKESCWLRQPFVSSKVSKQIREYAFSPMAPKEWKKNPNEWLSSLDIIRVMDQYQKAYKCFEFIGPTPIDFDKVLGRQNCVWNDLCNFRLSDKMNKGIKKIGIIFNTDPHDKPGQHWISMFIKLNGGKGNSNSKNNGKGEIFFFDSVGEPAPPEIMVLVERIKKQGEELNPPIHFTFDQNHPVEHQYGNTECGIYSLFFIVHMLEDKITKHYLKTHILKDKYMQNFRKIYFNDDL